MIRAAAVALIALGCGGPAAQIRAELDDVQARLDIARDSVRRADLGVTKANARDHDAAVRDRLAAVSEKAYLDAEKAYLEARLRTLDDPSPQTRADEAAARDRRDHLEAEWRARVKDASAPW